MLTDLRKHSQIEGLWLLNLVCIPGVFLHAPLIIWLETRRERQIARLKLIQEVMEL
jgi:hypothetical protein